MNRIFYEGLSEGTTLFGRYKIQRCLGSSDVSAVYLCTDNDAEFVVLKVANAAQRVAENSRKILEREIAFAKRVVHKNVISPISVHEDDEFIAFSMRYYERGTLADLIVPNFGIVPAHEGLRMVKEVAEGISALHAQGITHRDIKPENILIDGGMKPRIADFGLASYRMEDASLFDNCLVGTPEYLPPEYILEGKLDEKGDIYAFGVVAYQILTGELPYSGKDIYDTFSRKIRLDAVCPSRFNPIIPTQVNRMICRCLSRDPANRPTIEEVLSIFRPTSSAQVFTPTKRSWFKKAA
jgi:serine/threonine-protein kinase